MVSARRMPSEMGTSMLTPPPRSARKALRKNGWPAKAAAGVVGPRARKARQARERALDIADAGRAGDAVDREVEPRGAVIVSAHKAREIEAGDHWLQLLQKDPVSRPEQRFAIAPRLDD